MARHSDSMRLRTIQVDTEGFWLVYDDGGTERRALFPSTAALHLQQLIIEHRSDKLAHAVTVAHIEASHATIDPVLSIQCHEAGLMHFRLPWTQVAQLADRASELLASLGTIGDA